jgi:transcriptional regulator with AAA-type ATPase domain/tetratricopeptide (TPR) repeat protein
MDLLVDLLGQSPEIVALREKVERLLSGRFENRRLPPVLIQGETGTGKGLVARGLHDGSPLARGPFVDVNCAAIPDTLLEAELFGFERGAFTDARQAKPGLFQVAHRGTIFLDEIGLLSPALQTKLLKVIEEKTVRRLGSTRSEPVDTWVLSATNEDLADAIRERRFREDLYHRIALITLKLPPLRTRGDDILLLAEHFLARACADYGLSPLRLAADARAMLVAHRWPGNIRELSNVIERAALLADAPTLAASHLALPEAESPALPETETPATGSPTGGPQERLERGLARTGWNISRTAELLGISRNTVKARMTRYGLRAPKGDPVEPSDDAPPHQASPPAPASPPERQERLRWERRWITALRVVVDAVDGVNVYQLAPVVEDLVEKAQSFGAHVEELHPSGFTAFFGLDPMEDGPHRAALTAQAIHKTLERAGAESVTATATLHVAECLIARGTSRVGMDAGDRRRVSEALDALRAASPGPTLASRDGARFLRNTFELEAVGADDAGVTAYRVGQQVRADFQARGRARSPFVGRQDELTRLDELLTQAERGHGQVVEVVGEPGLGKSRLLAEFRERLAPGRVSFVEAHCAAYGRSTPYLPIIGLSRAVFRFAESDAAAFVAERVRQEVGRVGLETDAVVPYLLHMLGIQDESQTPLPPLSPEAMRIRTREAVRQVLVASGRHRPMVVAIEDVQWIDPTSEEILAALAESAVASPILLLTTYRHGYRPPWLGKGYACQLALRRLRRAESQTIVTSSGWATTLTAHVVDEIVARADGNPFFLEELARAVSEEGAVPAGAVIPDTIQGVLTARLDRLSAADRTVLEAAAVLGRDGAVSVLKEIAGVPDTEFAPALARLRAAEFLHEVAVVPVPQYAFEHVLTQEVAYRGLSTDRRRALHATTAQAIERLMPSVVERSPELLAQHHAGAGQVTQAIGYWHRAGQFASRRSAHAEAIEHLTKGLELVETLPETPVRVQTDLALRLALVASLIATRGEASVPVDATLARAQALARQLGESPQLFPVHFGVWRLSLARAQLPAAEETAKRLLDIAEPGADAGRRMAAHLATGMTAYFMGHLDRARLHLEQSLTFHLPEFGPAQILTYGQNLEAGALGYLSSTLGIMGYLDQAAACADRGLEVARRSEHPFTVAFALMLCGHTRQLRREPAAIKRLGDELAALSRDQGFVWFATVALGLTGSAEAAEHPTGPGLDLMREGAHSFLTFHRLGLAYRTHLAEALLRAGCLAEALDVVESTLAHADETREHSHVADLHRLRGESLALMSRRAEAQAAFLLAFDVASRQGARLFALRAATALVTLAAQSGGRVPAADRERLAAACAGFTEGFDLEDLSLAGQLLDAR